ncbi:hypothetical protein GCM10009646_55500 [Streptomyces aureus]
MSLPSHWARWIRLIVSDEGEGIGSAVRDGDRRIGPVVRDQGGCGPDASSAMRDGRIGLGVSDEGREDRTRRQRSRCAGPLVRSGRVRAVVSGPIGLCSKRSASGKSGNLCGEMPGQDL